MQYGCEIVVGDIEGKGVARVEVEKRQSECICM